MRIIAIAARHSAGTSKSRVCYIGKEANRWEEQSYIGIDPETEIAYGMAPEDRGPVMAEIKQAAGLHGPVAMAKAAGESPAAFERDRIGQQWRPLIGC